MSKKTHKPTTRLSLEQVIIAQLQGSTESSSQLFKTPCGSSNSLLTPIKASTERTPEKGIQYLPPQHIQRSGNEKSWWVHLHGCEARSRDREEGAKKRGLWRQRRRQHHERACWEPWSSPRTKVMNIVRQKNTNGVPKSHFPFVSPLSLSLSLGSLLLYQSFSGHPLPLWLHKRLVAVHLHTWQHDLFP